LIEDRKLFKKTEKDLNGLNVKGIKIA
jgi:hypothetical protein